jgi:NADH dehydrogenase FAD-containing subunit
VKGHSGVWALGDCVETPIPGGDGKTYAPTAQNATREGWHVARNIAALQGKPPQPFVYTPLGKLALVGERGCGERARRAPIWDARLGAVAERLSRQDAAPEQAHSRRS